MGRRKSFDSAAAAVGLDSSGPGLKSPQVGRVAEMTIEELESVVANMQVKRARDAYIAANIRWMRDSSYGNTIELGFWERTWKDLIKFYGDIIDPSLKSATIRREEWEK